MAAAYLVLCPTLAIIAIFFGWRDLTTAGRRWQGGVALMASIAVLYDAAQTGWE